MKKILVILLFLFTLVPVSAEENCTTITYYSKKEWVEYSDLIDTRFSINDNGFLNKNDILVKYNILGNWSYPKLASYDSFMGLDKVVKEATSKSDPNYFSISFDEEVYVENISFKINAFNDDKSISKSVYTNSSVKWNNELGIASRVGGNYITTTNDTDTVNITINDYVENIHIFFDDYKDENIYEFEGFQINNYKVYQHVEWVLDYIEDTETSTTTICSGTGKFTPNGNKDWEYYSNTSFSPSIEAINYTPVLKDSGMWGYDVGRGNYISAYSEPWIIRNWIGGLSWQIAGWSGRWSSYGSGGSSYPYIVNDSNANTGIIYSASPVYWSQSNYGGYYSKSNDSGWCNHTTGSSRTPCYKYGGHSSNSRLNSYDVSIKTYTNIIPPELRVIKHIDYYLIDQYGNESHILRSDDSVFTHNFNKTGTWQIKAVITDMANKTGTVTSDKFYIDRDSPYVVFSGLDSDVIYNQTQNLIINPKDNHSGVDRYRYYISNDDGQTWSKPSKWLETNSYAIQLNATGKWKVKVEVEDKVGNKSINYSDRYNIVLAEATVSNLFVPAYEKGIEQTLLASIECIDCVGSEVVEYKVLVDGNVILDDVSVNDKIDLQVDFTSIEETINVDVITSIKGIDKENKLSLTAHSISNEYKTTTTNQLVFDGATMYSATKDGNNIYYENLTLNLNHKDEYYAGEGIEAYIDISYFNECESVENYRCIRGDDLSVNKSLFIFEDGAEDVKYDYYSNGNYQVEAINANKKIYLPQMYVALEDGKVYDHIPSVEYLDGYNRWYTNQRAELKDYFIKAKGIVGINKFRYNFDSLYTINESLSDQYRTRFVDLDNPFPNQESHLWKDSNWFETIE